jgi:plastocyanin
MRGRGTRTTSLIAAACVVASGVTLATTVAAGPEEIKFPAEYQKWEKYAVVDRYDNKQYRELYTSPEAVKAVREGKPIPDGTVIAMAIHAAKVDAAGAPVKDANGRFVKDKLTGVTVMEKRKGWGASVPETYRNGDWQYASFLPDGKPNADANGKIEACFQCHLPHEKQDFVISLAKLNGSFPSGAAALKSGPQDVGIQGFSFGPSAIQVAKGQSVTWTNGDDSPHQVMVNGKPLKTQVLLKGQSASLEFTEPGTYEYGCALHPAMKGKVEVK